MLALGAIGLATGLVQHGAWATLPAAPDLSLALLAWAVVDGDEDGLALRALVLGLAQDLTTPGSTGFHLGMAMLVALVAVPARRVLFRARLAAWAIGGFGAWLLVSLIDSLLGGPGDRWTGLGLAGGVGTAAAAAVWGWLLGGLPAPWRPIPPAGA